MTWINFMSGYKGPHGNFGKRSWTDAFNTGNYSGNQIKVALQEQGQAGYSLGSGLRTEYMQKHQGAGHADNPLGKYQGPHGNFGRLAYNEAKLGGGWKPQDIYDEIQSGRSGMQMMGGALEQYNIDIADEQAARDAAKWRTDLQTQLTDLNNQINEPVAPPGVGYSAPSVVGKSGTRGANLKIAERGSRSGTKRWKRGGDSSWSMATVNTGGTSGKASNSSAVNV
jgi:hypothetical protein